MKCTYASDVPGHDYQNTLVVTRDGGGDFLIGVQHEANGLNHGTHYVRFRRANGGASQHPRLIAALAELEAALNEIASDEWRPGMAAANLGGRAEVGGDTK